MADAIIRIDPLVSIGFTAVEPVLNPATGAGLLCEARPLGANPGRRGCGVAAVGSTRVVGIARWDVPAARVTPAGAKVGDEHGLTVVSGTVCLITLATAAIEGDLLVAAANGQLAVSATPAVGAVVGKALAAGATGSAIEAYIGVIA